MMWPEKNTHGCVVLKRTPGKTRQTWDMTRAKIMIRIAHDCGEHGHFVYRNELIKQQKQSKHTSHSSAYQIFPYLPPQQS